MSLMPPRRRRAEMNLLPLIDVLVMLIFFAFVTMQFKAFNTLNITLPKIETAGKNELNNPLTIAIDQEGALSVNGMIVTAPEFEAQVRAVAAISLETPVLLKVHEETPVKEVTRAMDVCRAAGLNKIRLQSR